MQDEPASMTMGRVSTIKNSIRREIMAFTQGINRLILNLRIGQRLQAAFLFINLIFLAVAVVAIVGLQNQRASLKILQFNQEQINLHLRSSEGLIIVLPKV